MRAITPVCVLAAACGLASSATAQVVINEVFENPPNGGDSTWEYIELYGPPGFDLTGYAVALVKGGQDIENGADDIPDGDKAPEIDEAFGLDGWEIGPNGFFVLYNGGSFGFTGLDRFLTPNPGWNFFQVESTTNKRFLDGAEFQTLHIPSVDDSNNLENDGSSTYVLVRRRPGHSLDAQGRSVYASSYAWKKDVTPDVDFNSRLDFGDEHLLGVPVYYGHGLEDEQDTALQMKPVQVVDEIAWSNAGGKEYNTPGRGTASNKISETPSFNPDCATRVRYLRTNPLIGWTIDSDGDLKRNNTADENWIYGETLNVEPGSDDYLFYKPLYEPGPDAALGTADDELNHLAPTDPLGPFYSYAGPGDPNPLAAPFFAYSGARDPGGDVLIEPYDITGFAFTPGAFNDAPQGTPLASTEIGTQFRFVRGDANFDGVVNLLDLAFAADHLGAGLDDTRDAVRDFNTDDTADDVVYTDWAYQLEEFNGLMAVIRADLTDGSTGEWDSGKAVTQADVDAVYAMLPNDPDRNGDGAVDVEDLYELAAAPVDLDGDGDADRDDTAHLMAYIRRHEQADMKAGRRP